MPKYRKKPVVIEAFEVKFDQPEPFGLGYSANIKDAPPWFWAAVTEGRVAPKRGVDHSYVEIRTLEGTMIGDAGDFIIQGVKGELYPCKPEIFAMTYEAVE